MNRKGILSTAAAISALAFAGGAWAQDSDDSGFYLGGGVGEFQVDIDDSTTSTRRSTAGKATTPRGRHSSAGA